MREVSLMTDTFSIDQIEEESLLTFLFEFFPVDPVDDDDPEEIIQRWD